MNLVASNYSIAEIRDMLERKDLVVNRDYQRGARLWPVAPRSYFIDTVLSGFPFPKLYFYEFLDRVRRTTRREIVDGQQRISAMMDFLEGKYALTSASPRFAGMRFSDLDEDVQDAFLTYPIPVDVIRNAEKTDILEMFRRMNAYTLPLNDAEKRHSTFQGPFKWFVNEMASEQTSMFLEYGVFTNRQVVRMADAEVIAEMVLSLEKGIVSSSNKVLSDLYRRYDQDFPHAEDYSQRLAEVFEFVISHLGEMRRTHLMKPYVVHALFIAMMHNRYGLPGVTEAIGLEPIGRVARDLETAVRSLEALARTHEAKETEGEFAEYVWSCLGGTNREPRRRARVRFLCLALRGELT